MLTRDDIAAICPPPRAGWRRLIWDGYVKALTSQNGWRLLVSYQVTTPNRLIGLLACVCAPETGLALMWESGAYSAKGIVDTFGAHRHSSAITPAEASRIAALPVNPDGSGLRCEVLFERAYGLGIAHCCKKPAACTHKDSKGRLLPCQARSLGNTQPGDGWRFRGLGLVQATGRDAHTLCAEEIGCTLTGLSDPINSLHMLLIEWDEKNCNEYADREEWVSIRKLINAGRLDISASKINGIPEMNDAIKRAKAVIGPEDFTGEPISDVPSPKEPAVADSLPAPPASMAQSTEGKVAIGVKGTGLYELWVSFKDAWFGAKTGSGVQLMDLGANLFFDERFWMGALLVFSGALWWLKRRQKLTLWGV